MTAGVVFEVEVGTTVIAVEVEEPRVNVQVPGEPTVIFAVTPGPSLPGGGSTTWEGLDKPEFIGAGSTAASARAAIGAGTSNLALGSTSDTAKPGDYEPDLSGKADASELQALSDAVDSLTEDDIPAGATNKKFTDTEKSKLAGIANSATANDTDAHLKDRANHTGTQTSSTISDFTEAAQDAVAALLAGASGVTLSYNDAANTLTVTGPGSSSQLAEDIRDAIGVALIGSGAITVAVNDAADTITISTSATQNDTDANLRDRSTHTGSQAASTISDFTAAARTAVKSYYDTATAVMTNKDLTSGTNTFPTFNQNTTGNAATATKLATSRAINGVSFDGSADITVADATKVPTTRTVNGHALSADVTVTKSDLGLGSVDNTADSSKSVATAAALTTARTINGVSFDGSANITVADSTKVPTTRTVNGHALSADVTVTKSDVGLGNVDNTADSAKTVASATQATKLATPRNINGVAFDGSADVTVGLAAANAVVATSEATSSSTYTDLTTTTDSVTVTVGASGIVMLMFSAEILVGTNGARAYVGFAVSGATTRAADDTTAMYYKGYASSTNHKAGISQLVTGLTPGSTTFKLKYKTSSGTGTYQDRRIAVVPL